MFTITSIVVIEPQGATDLVLIHTDLPSTVWGEDTVTLQCNQAMGHGAQWVRNHLGREPDEIIKG